MGVVSGDAICYFMCLKVRSVTYVTAPYKSLGAFPGGKPARPDFCVEQ